MKILSDLKLAGIVSVAMLSNLASVPQLVCGQDANYSEAEGSLESETSLATSGEIPEELRDSAFDRYVELDNIGRAWGNLDASAMTDVALQLREAERVLQRSHKAIQGSKVMELTLSLAIKNQDQDSLARLAKVAKDSGDADLSQRVAAATKLAAASRSTEAPLMVSAGETTVEGFIEIQDLMKRLNAASVASDAAGMNAVLESIVGSIHLTEKQREQLTQMATQAKSGFAQQNDTEGDATMDALDKLAGPSRSKKPFYYNVVYSAKLKDTRYFDTYQAALASRKLDVAPPRRFECSEVFVTPTLFTFPPGVVASKPLPKGCLLLKGKNVSIIADMPGNADTLVGNDGASAQAAIESAGSVDQILALVAAGGLNLDGLPLVPVPPPSFSVLSTKGVRRLVYKKSAARR